MKGITLEELKILDEMFTELAVSIYVPTQKGSTNYQTNLITYKNALKQLKKHFLAARVPERLKNDILEQLESLAGRLRFDDSYDGTLAVFASPEELHYYYLPTALDTHIYVGQTFDTEPLYVELADDLDFYVLALSQSGVRLFKGSHYFMEELKLEGLDKDLSSALRIDELQQQLQTHAASPSGQRGSEVLHGHGGAKDRHKDLVVNYFRNIDKQLHKILKNAKAPLVLIGVDYLLPIYRRVSSYKHVLDKNIYGNPERMSVDELHDRAWPLMQQYAV